jgi:predicted MFS family arabinose efflux permease
MRTDRPATPPVTENDARSRAATGWRTVAGAAFGLTFGPSVLTVIAFGAFIAPLDREFGWGVPAIALGASILSFMIMIVSPLQGVLVDRFGGRRVVLSSIPPFALSLMAMYFLPASLPVFYLAWVLIPLCGLGVWPASYLRLTAGWFERRLGLALGLANAGIGVGSVIVPILTAVLIGTFGWRTAFLGLGVVALLAFPVAYFLLAEPARRVPEAAAGGLTLREASATRPFWLNLAAFLLLGTFSTTIIVHQIRLLLDAGIPPRVANLMPVALGLALIIARIGTGWLLDRLAAGRVMAVFLAFGAVAALLFASGPSVPTAILAATLSGLLIGAEFDVLSYLIPRYFGRRAFGRIYGITFAVFQLGAAVATYAVGASRAGSGSYAPAMTVLAVGCLVGIALFLALGPYRYDPHRPDVARSDAASSDAGR